MAKIMEIIEKETRLRSERKIVSKLHQRILRNKS